MTLSRIVLPLLLCGFSACGTDPLVFENHIPFTPDKRLLADHVISVFENNTPTLQYGYAENLHDGRGITAGRAGFTSGTGDMLLVVQNYTALVANNALSQYLPALQTLSATEDSATTGLDNLIADWAVAAQDSLFRVIQDEVVDELYYLPALEYCVDLGIHTPLGLLCVYDAIIQHGDGEDPDGLSALIESAGKSPDEGRSEEVWLKKFNQARRKVLLDPYDADTQAEWSESVGRVDVLLQLLEASNFELTPPLVINPYGDEFTLTH